MMPTEGPFAAEHILYTFGGGMPGGDIWAIGMRTVPASVTLDQLTNLAHQAHLSFSAAWIVNSGLASHNPPTVTYGTCTARTIGTNGKTIQVANGFAGNALPGVSVQLAPNQSALVVSLRTNLAGRRARGRVYLPYLSPTFGAGDDRIVADQILAAVTNFKGIIDQINATSTQDYGPFPIAVQSRANPPSSAVVTSIAVGNVMDTQRRRRNKVSEVYQTLPIVVPPPV